MDVFGVVRDVGGIVASLVVAWVALYVRSEIAAVKAKMDQAMADHKASVSKEIGDMRVAFLQALAEDKQETRNWINGSFMRASLVDSRLSDLARRVDRLEAQ